MAGVLAVLAGIIASAVAGLGGLGRRVARVLPDRLPGVPEYVGDFKINTVEDPRPTFVEDGWTFVIDGLVEEPVELTWKEFAALPRAAMTVDFICVEGWSVSDVSWQGPRVADLLRRARPKPEAKFVVFHADGGTYTDSLSVEQARDPRAMLAVNMDGAALDPRQGTPVRLVVPWMYGYKSVKWVRRLELVDEFEPGYWERRGYPADATIRV